MEPDTTYDTIDGLSLQCYDTAKHGGDLPSSLPGDHPLESHELNASWWKFIRGSAGRLLWADAWNGSEETKADAVQYTLQAIDLLQKPVSYSLQGNQYNWPDQNADPDTLWSFIYGEHFNLSNIIGHEITAPETAWIAVELPNPSLIRRIEVDAEWTGIPSNHRHDFYVWDNFVLQNQQTFIGSGTQTIVYEPGATALMPNGQYYGKLQIGSKLTLFDDSLPYELRWLALRVFCFGNPLE